MIFAKIENARSAEIYCKENRPPRGRETVTKILLRSNLKADNDKFSRKWIDGVREKKFWFNNVRIQQQFSIPSTLDIKAQ